MVFRNVIFDGGTATVFVLVTGAWFFGLMIGWRLVVSAVVAIRKR
jgi:hypothetical protein